jgi:hypothetical protein
MLLESRTTISVDDPMGDWPLTTKSMSSRGSYFSGTVSQIVIEPPPRSTRYGTLSHAYLLLLVGTKDHPMPKAVSIGLNRKIMAMQLVNGNLKVPM